MLKSRILLNICNGVDATAPSYNASPRSVISGRINVVDAVTLFGKTGAVISSKNINNKITYQQGGLWLTPNAILNSIQVDLGMGNLDPAPINGIAPPMVAPIKVPIDASGNYSVESSCRYRLFIGRA